MTEQLKGFSPDPPASAEAIDRLVAECGVELPPAYVEQLCQSNGGAGDLAVEPGWIQFWPAEEILEANAGYEVAENIPGFFGFGSSGGGELLAFRIIDGRAEKIFMIPFIPMEESYALLVAETFEDLRQHIGRALPGAEHHPASDGAQPDASDVD